MAYASYGKYPQIKWNENEMALQSLAEMMQQQNLKYNLGALKHGTLRPQDVLQQRLMDADFQKQLQAGLQQMSQNMAGRGIRGGAYTQGLENVAEQSRIGGLQGTMGLYNKMFGEATTQGLDLSQWAKNQQFQGAGMNANLMMQYKQLKAQQDAAKKKRMMDLINSGIGALGGIATGFMGNPKGFEGAANSLGSLGNAYDQDYYKYYFKGGY